MFSSLNAFGGLSATDIQLLFGSNSPSSSSSSQISAAPPPASTGIDSSGANNPANAIQAILAQAEIADGQMATSTGWASVFTAQAAYEEQAGDSSSLVSASVTISSPDAVQQITDAISAVDQDVDISIPLSPTLGLGEPLGDLAVPAVTAADAVNVTMNGGAVSTTAALGASFPNGLPSASTIQNVLSQLKIEDEQIGWNGSNAAIADPDLAPGTAEDKSIADAWWDTADESFTLVQLPANSGGGIGGNMAVFDSDGTTWALVLPQNNVSVTLSETQTTG